jgi:transcription antitermination factor NusG
VTEIGGATPGFEISNRDAVRYAMTADSEELWFAVRTRPRHEKKVATDLHYWGIHTFLPLVAERHRWSDRFRTVEMPLFPGYLFTRIAETAQARISVLRTAGTVGFVGVQGKGLPIPQDQIEAVRLIIDRGISFLLHPFVREGQRVRIRGGCLDGVQGILTAKNADQSLIVSIEIIQRSLAIRVAGYRVEPA